jgi:biotin synthase-like enzyme
MATTSVTVLANAAQICQSTIAQFCSNAVWIDVKPEFDTIRESVKRIHARVHRGNRVQVPLDDKWLD